MICLHFIDLSVMFSIYNYGEEVFKNWMLISIIGILGELCNFNQAHEQYDNRKNRQLEWNPFFFDFDHIKLFFMLFFESII